MADPKILFEDSSVLAIDKPAGLVVNRATSVKETTVQDWADKYLQILNPKSEILKKSQITNSKAQNSLEFRVSSLEFFQRSGIVHRIDKETSGILLIAKNPEAFQELQRQFKEREIEKTYLALVHGSFDLGSGVIKAPLGRLPWNRERFGILAGGRESETKYLVTQSHSNSDKKRPEKYSLVEFYPKTGRTHQIRVHAKYINHPLVSDEFYAGRKTSRRDREWCPRLFLHAKEIVFTHPTTKERIKVTSELPEDLQKALSTLEKN